MFSRIRQWAFALLFGSILASSSSQIPTDGLVAYYPLDGNANDASGNNLHGTAFAVVGTTNRLGEQNGALLFDGVESFINCSNPAAFNFASNFTIAAWIKTTGNQINKYIIAKYDFGVSTHSYGLGTAGNSQPYGFVMGDGPGYVDGSGNVNLNDEKWHAVALVYSAEKGITVYANGLAYVAGPAPNFHPFTNAVPLMIGKTFSGQNFGGAIDDVRIYNRALSDFEVSQLGPGASLRITLQPNNYYAAPGATVPLRVGAATEGTSERIQIQWFRNGELVEGLTNASVSIVSVEPRQDIYRARVRVGNLEEWSNEATITFTSPGEAKLLAHYKFDNDTTNSVIDEIGGFAGLATNVVYAPGRVGTRSIRFNGTNSYVRLPYPASPLDLAGTPYTVAFFMKLEQITASGQQMLWMADAADFVGGWGCLSTSSQFTWMHNSGGVDAWYTTSAFRPGTNWLHLAMVWNGFNRNLYTNGTLMVSVPTSNAIVSERNDDLFFGSRNGTSLFMRGNLDDVRIYNYALATDEIAQLAQGTPTIVLSAALQTGNLLISWPFLDGTYNYRVEFATSLDAGAQWTPASGIPQRTGDTYSLSQAVPTSARFYRLRRL